MVIQYRTKMLGRLILFKNKDNNLNKSIIIHFPVNQNRFQQNSNQSVEKQTKYMKSPPPCSSFLLNCVNSPNSFLCSSGDSPVPLSVTSKRNTPSTPSPHSPLNWVCCLSFSLVVTIKLTFPPFEVNFIWQIIFKSCHVTWTCKYNVDKLLIYIKHYSHT